MPLFVLLSFGVCKLCCLRMGAFLFWLFTFFMTLVQATLLILRIDLCLLGIPPSVLLLPVSLQVLVVEIH